MTKKTIAAISFCVAASCGCGDIALGAAYGISSVASGLQVVQEKDWRPINGITVFSWYQNAPLIPESTLVRRFAVRFKANGKVTPLTSDKLRLAGEQLLATHPDLDRFRIPGKTYDNKPRYFMDKRLFMVSVDPPILVLVPAKFLDRDKVLATGAEIRYDEVNSAYYRFSQKESAMGIKSLDDRPENWLNYLEFSSVVPKTEGIEVISPWWPQPVPLKVALADERWDFHLEESRAFPEYLELTPRKAQPFLIDP